MSYDIHIRRSETRGENDKPITLDEIESLLGKLPPGFSIKRESAVTAKTPQGVTISVETGSYIVYKNPENKKEKAQIYFGPRGPWFSVSNEKAMLPIIDLADKMNFIVQGDEGEIYTKESVMKSISKE